jgi:hypothetical protein
MTARKLFPALAATVVMTLSLPAGAAVDGVSAEYATGIKVRTARLAMQSRWEQRWLARNGWHLGGYWDFELAQWRARAYQNVGGQHQSLTDIGVTPVFRWQADDAKRWYLEGGIGAHLLSQLYDNDSRKLSTSFQFGDHVGAGYVFDNGWDVGMKFQHFSNGGIKEPNAGINFVVFKLGRKF